MAGHCLMRACERLIVLVILTLHVAAARAAPPKVVQIIPANEAQDVDPGLRGIRVEFDQDMSEGSHSWVGGGESFPKLRGVPYWESPRVAVLPVELQPEHEYWLSINSGTFTNFRSRAGEPAEPYPLSFRTGPARSGRDMAEVIAAENKAAVEVLRRTVERYYAYIEVHKVDWDKAFAEFTPRLEAAKTPEEFATEAGRLLAKAEDLHISVRFGQSAFPVHSRSVSANCNLPTVRKLVPGWQKRSPQVAGGRFDDGIGYILVATWEAEHAQALEAAFEALDDLADTKALIIDVRLNAGGDEQLARKFAGCFVDKRAVYARNVYRAPDSPGGFTEPLERVVEPTKGRPRYRGKLAVLMGPQNMSSCESFLLMMKQVPGCKLIGARSYGSSGNPRPYGLPNGVVVHLPSWKDMTPDGKCIEGVGIAPDIEVGAAAEAFERADPVLEAALKLLRR